MNDTGLDEEPRRPDILVLHMEDVPNELLGDFIPTLEAPSLRIHTMALSSGAYAGAEIYLPAAVGIFIAGSYFGGFLSKAGGDHYEALKSAAIGLWKRLRHVRVTPVGTAGKVKPSQQFSLAYAITGELLPRLRFKFMLRTSFTDDEAAVAIVRFLDLIRDIHQGTLDEELLKALLLYRPVGGTVIVTFDPISNSIVPVIDLRSATDRDRVSQPAFE